MVYPEILAVWLPTHIIAPTDDAITPPQLCRMHMYASNLSTTSLVMALLKHIRKVNKSVRLSHKRNSRQLTSKWENALAAKGKYNDYMPEQIPHIGKYAAENGPTRAAKDFSQVLKG